MREALRGAPRPGRWLVLDAEAMVQVDSAGLAAIEEVAGDLARDGVTLVVARMRAGTRPIEVDASLLGGPVAGDDGEAIPSGGAHDMVFASAIAHTRRLPIGGV